MKIGICYTVTTPELTALVEKELKAQLGDAAEFLVYADESVLSETKKAGCVPAKAASRLASLYMSAINDGADAILNCCSSVGGVADAMQDFARFVNVPVVRIDELMCRKAVRLGKRIGIMATLKSTLEPTKALLLRCAQEAGAGIETADCLVDGAFGLPPASFTALMAERAKTLAPGVDVIVLAQGSMAFSEQAVAQAAGLPVLSSPRYGAQAVRLALESKGLL